MIDLALDSPRLSPAGLKAFFSIAAQWGLTTSDEIKLLGDPPQADYLAWKRASQSVVLEQGTLERISYVLGIYKALQILLPDPRQADAWIQSQNTASWFGGKRPLGFMLGASPADSKEGLRVTRQYLEAVCEGGP